MLALIYKLPTTATQTWIRTRTCRIRTTAAQTRVASVCSAIITSPSTITKYTLWRRCPAHQPINWNTTDINDLRCKQLNIFLLKYIFLLFFTTSFANGVVFMKTIKYIYRLGLGEVLIFGMKFLETNRNRSNARWSIAASWCSQAVFAHVDSLTILRNRSGMFGQYWCDCQGWRGEKSRKKISIKTRSLPIRNMPTSAKIDFLWFRQAFSDSSPWTGAIFGTLPSKKLSQLIAAANVILFRRLFENYSLDVWLNLAESPSISSLK